MHLIMCMQANKHSNRALFFFIWHQSCQNLVFYKIEDFFYKIEEFFISMIILK